MFQIMTVHVFDFTMLLEERMAGGRAGSGGRVGSERLWNSAVLNMAPRWDSNQGQKKKKKKRQTSTAQIQIAC